MQSTHIQRNYTEYSGSTLHWFLDSSQPCVSCVYLIYVVTYNFERNGLVIIKGDPNTQMLNFSSIRSLLVLGVPFAFPWNKLTWRILQKLCQQRHSSRVNMQIFTRYYNNNNGSNSRSRSSSSSSSEKHDKLTTSVHTHQFNTLN